MKKIMIALLALAMLLCAASCTEAGGAYAFTYNGVRLVIDEQADEKLAAIGAPVSTYETGTCGRGDRDRMYVYADFRVTTAEIDGVQYFEAIELLSDQASTEEGVTIGSSKQAVLDAYGDPTKSEGDTLQYSSGSVNLYFYLAGNQTVKSILYKFAK